ncbi:hypothetical protein C9J85_11385 [Haloferax sp. wsp5]|nr:hypothetical protein C9J85_11385 [Haloferax sp. wsp5]
MDLSQSSALVEFNNKYHIPRLARTVKLITKAQGPQRFECRPGAMTAAQASANSRASASLAQVVFQT